MAKASASKKVILKRFDRPDEHRDFKGHGFMDVVMLTGGTIVGRGEFQPGWRWSNDVKPLAGTQSCEVSHKGFCLKGSMVIRMNSGEEFTIKAGDAFDIPPGHDAWVDGNENCQLIDVVGASGYAAEKRAGGVSEESLAQQIPHILSEGFNNRDVEKTLSVISDQVEWIDVATQTLFRGKEGFRQFEEAWLQAFPDGKVEIINAIAHGDRVVVEYLAQGTHSGTLETPMGTLKSTGKHILVPMCDVMQIQDGKVIRGHTYYNSAAVLQQLEEALGPETKAA